MEEVKTPIRSWTRGDDVGLDRAGRVEIENVDFLLLLPETVDSTDPLLHLHGIPGQVVVDHRRAELEVEALTGHPGRKHDVKVAVAESRDDSATFQLRHSAVQLACPEPFAESIA